MQNSLSRRIAAIILILFAIFALGIASCSEDRPPRERGIGKKIDKDAGTITYIEVELVLHPSYKHMQDEYDDYEMEGVSHCMRSVAENWARCEIHIVEPQKIDGEHTLTLGHEVLHGVWGLYHDQEDLSEYDDRLDD